MTEVTPTLATRIVDAEGDWHRAERRLLTAAMNVLEPSTHPFLPELHYAALDYREACLRLRALDEEEGAAFTLAD